MRAEPVQIGTLIVLNDCYNANPASMRNALLTLRNLRPSADANRDRRLVFICGEMASSVSRRKPCTRNWVQRGRGRGGPARHGRRSARVTARTAREATRQDLAVQSFDDAVTACDHLRKFIREDDIVLVKGSRMARLERVVQKLRELFSSEACDAARGTA